MAQSVISRQRSKWSLLGVKPTLVPRFEMTLMTQSGHRRTQIAAPQNDA
jgi:hypothetical protein